MPIHTVPQVMSPPTFGYADGKSTPFQGHRTFHGKVHQTSHTRQHTHSLKEPVGIAEQHEKWREQGRNASNFQQAGFERAAQGSEQTARDEVHVAVSQATEKCLERRCGKEWVVSKIKHSQPGLLIKLVY